MNQKTRKIKRKDHPKNNKESLPKVNQRKN